MKREPLYLPRIRGNSQADGRPSWPFTGKTMGILVLLLVLGSLVGSFYLNQASHTAAAGMEVVRLTRERERWRQENAQLRKLICEMEAWSSVKRRAEELGFVEAEAVEYLTVQNLPVEHPDQEAPPPGSREEASQNELASHEAAWWEELKIQFESWMDVRR